MNILFLNILFFIGCRTPNKYIKSNIPKELLGKWELIKSTSINDHTSRVGQCITFTNEGLILSDLGEVKINYELIDSVISLSDTLIFNRDSVRSSYNDVYYLSPEEFHTDSIGELKVFYQIGKIEYISKDSMKLSLKNIFIEANEVYRKCSIWVLDHQLVTVRERMIRIYGENDVILQVFDTYDIEEGYVGQLGFGVLSIESDGSVLYSENSKLKYLGQIDPRSAVKFAETSFENIRNNNPSNSIVFSLAEESIENRIPENAGAQACCTSVLGLSIATRAIALR